jgi:hypothetical protein
MKTNAHKNYHRHAYTLANMQPNTHTNKYIHINTNTHIHMQTQAYTITHQTIIKIEFEERENQGETKKQRYKDIRNKGITNQDTKVIFTTI